MREPCDACAFQGSADLPGIQGFDCIRGKRRLEGVGWDALIGMSDLYVSGEHRGERGSSFVDLTTPVV